MKLKNQTKKSIGIRGKLIALLLPSIIVLFAILILIIYFSTSKIVLSQSKALLQSNSESVVHSTEAWMNHVITALNTERDTLEYFPMTKAEELNYIKHTANQDDAFPAGIYVANLDGSLEHSSFVPGPDFSAFEKSWYKNGIKSDQFVFGTVYFDEDSKSYVVGASGILKDKSGNVRGVAAADIYLDAISSIVKNVRLEKTGGMFLVEKGTGMIIGHKDPSLLGTALAKQDNPIYAASARLIEENKTGLQTVKGTDHKNTDLYLTDIPGSPWMAVAYVPGSEVLASLNALAVSLIIIAVIFVCLLSLMILLLIRKIIINPVKKIDYAVRQIAEGRLDQSIDHKSHDEFGTLASNFNLTVERLRNYVYYIDEISSVLDQIANGDLSFSLTYDYAGEFETIKNALEHISQSLNSTLGQIGQSARQVASGSDQVAMGAQALSQGASEQASAVEELASTIDEISAQVAGSAHSAAEARSKMEHLGKDIQRSNSQMKEMTNAMEEISKSAKEIGVITKTIEDISFQTNILALNAAVEAARAGTAGKGFAVVADEVRTLATKSAEAAKSTTVLIQSSIQAVELGTKLAQDTARSLLEVVSDTHSAIQVVGSISDSSRRQADSIVQVTQGMEQISSVVQTNSASAEQSAAASEELSGQAQMMKNLISHFRLKP